MAFTSLPGAGTTLTASTLSSLITELRPLFARKTANETVNNSATLQNDNDLFLSVAANTVYEMEGIFRYSTGATPDIKFMFTYPTGTTIRHIEHLISTGGGAWVDFAITETDLMAADGSASFMSVKGLVITSSTAGTLQLQWAQSTANASDTIVQAGSYLRLTKVA